MLLNSHDPLLWGPADALQCDKSAGFLLKAEYIFSLKKIVWKVDTFNSDHMTYVKVWYAVRFFGNYF